VLLFMRAVKSRLLWEQMQGRGTRVVNATDLQAVMPDAPVKDHFVLVDAVGVVDQSKAETQSLERKRSVSFEKLQQAVALGASDDDTLSSLAGRLARLDRSLSPQERYAVSAASGGATLRDLANHLLDAIDPDTQIEAAQQEAGNEPPTLIRLQRQLSTSVIGRWRRSPTRSYAPRWSRSTSAAGRRSTASALTNCARPALMQARPSRHMRRSHRSNSSSPRITTRSRHCRSCTTSRTPPAG
jgi:hypothetical protein